MSNYPDNMNWAAFNDRYGDRPALVASRAAHRIAALAELARRMGFDDCAEVLDERLGEELAAHGFDGIDRDELSRDVAREAVSSSDVALTSALLTGIGDHRIAEAKSDRARAIGAVQAFIRGVAA